MDNDKKGMRKIAMQQSWFFCACDSEFVCMRERDREKKREIVYAQNVPCTKFIEPQLKCNTRWAVFAEY